MCGSPAKGRTDPGLFILERRGLALAQSARPWPERPGQARAGRILRNRAVFQVLKPHKPRYSLCRPGTAQRMRVDFVYTPAPRSHCSHAAARWLGQGRAGSETCCSTQLNKHSGNPRRPGSAPPAAARAWQAPRSPGKLQLQARRQGPTPSRWAGDWRARKSWPRKADAKCYDNKKQTSANSRNIFSLIG